MSVAGASSTRSLGVAISGAGMVTPVGVGPLQTFTSVLTQLGRNVIAEDLYLCGADDPDFEDPDPVTVARIEYLAVRRAHIRDPAEWLGLLAALAFENLLESVPLEQAELSRLGMFLSLPPPRQGWGPAAHRDFSIHFHNHAQQDVFGLERFDDSGPAGGVTLLDAAARALREGQVALALVGGVESYLQVPWLAELDRLGRLKSNRNLDGFIPGEAAAFLLVEPGGQIARRGCKPLAELRAVATGTCDPAELQNNTGQTLAKVLGSVLRAGEEPPLVLTDLNGEPERMKEWGYVLSRLGGRLGSPCCYEHPADVLGDVGVASGALLCGLASLYTRLKYPGQSSVLAWAASDSGERAAVLLGLEGG